MSNLGKWDAFCSNIKYLRESQIESLLLNEIKKYDINCFCSFYDTVLKHIKYKKIQGCFAHICKSKCDFCRTPDKKKLYNKIKNCGYQTICSILSKEYLNSNMEILKDVLELNIYQIPTSELTKYLSINKHLITPALKNNIINNLSEKKENSFGIRIIKLILSNDNLITYNEEFILDCIMELINKNNVLSIYDIIPVESAINKGRLANVLILYLIKNSNYKTIANVLPLIDPSYKLYLPKTCVKKLLGIYSYLDTEQCVKLLNHLDNTFDIYVELINSNSTNRIELIIDNKYFLRSLNELFKNEETKKLMYVHYKPKLTFITETGAVGTDAGGLTKDFYTNLHKYLFSMLNEVDDHLIISDIANPDVNWKVIGNCFFRSVMMENIIPTIKLHPIICYFLINGNKITSVKTFLQEITKFDVGFFTEYTLKLFELPDNEFNDFLILQDETPKSKKDYLTSEITSRYLNKNSIAFINGFNDMFVQYGGGLTNIIKNKITPKILYDTLTINEKYNILENNSHSLKNNCEFIGITNPKFAQAFFGVLNDLNLTDVNKLKAFLQFWLGKSSIRSFNGEKCKIVQTTYQLHGCIKSSTCFNQIYVERTQTEGDNLKSYLIESINKTLNNQLISETAGLNMQNS